MQSVYIVLNDIRSAHNVGSVLRTADASGAKHVYMCGTTPVPIDRFGRKRKDIAKVALGAEETIKWEYFKDIQEVFLKLHGLGVRVVGVEQHNNSHPYTRIKTDKDTAFVFGEETKGLPEEIVSLCDEVVEIPMRGEKESLNVSVSAGVILFKFIENSF